jgi:hypothetical protein
VAPFVSLSPSGVVPGDGADGRSVELVLFFGGQGPDRVFHAYFRVLFVKVEDLIVISFSFVVLFVTCYPTV